MARGGNMGQKNRSRGGSNRARGGSNRARGSNHGRGGSNSGRSNKSHSRPPFKSRDRLKSYSQIKAAKRKYEEEHDKSIKKIKGESSDEEVKFSSDSETEEGPLDSHQLLMQTFTDIKHSAIDSDHDESDECEDSDDSEDPDGSYLSNDYADLETVSKYENNGDSDEQSNDESHMEQQSDESEEDLDDDDLLEKEEGSKLESEEDHNSDDDTDTDDIQTTKFKKNHHKNEQKSSIPSLQEEEEEEDVPEDNDPFCSHFERCLSDKTADALKDPGNWKQRCYNNWTGLPIIKHSYPSIPTTNNISDTRPKPRRKMLSLNQDVQQQPTIAPPLKQPDLENFDINTLFIKKIIQKNVSDKLTHFQKQMLSLVSNYSDVFYPESTYDKWDEVTSVYCIHVANHILKTRARIMKNNAKLNKAMTSNTELDMAHFQDQGYARAKVLFLLPSRHSAYRVVNSLIEVLQLKGNRDDKNKTRFEEEFGPGEEQTGARQRSKRDKAPDFIATFTGDTGDDFKIGLTLNKRSMRLYSGFYGSDIILASPLGLRRSTGIEGDEDVDTGFLTSIEILIMDQADMFQMQNWDHVQSVFDSVNGAIRTVAEIKTDVGRVRSWMVDGHARHYRQTILSSSVFTNEQNTLFASTLNFAGRVQLFQSSLEGVMSQVLVSAELVLLRAPGLNDQEARLLYFTKELMPQHIASKKAYTLLYIPSYYDYLSINQYLSRERDIDFSSINEYMTTKMSHVAVARSDFFKGQSKLLLYTERFHFYKRPTIKGIRHIIFYHLPTYPHFFTEMCNMMLASKQNSGASRQQKLMRPSITVVFQDSDVTQLSATLGTDNMKELLQSKKRVHICTITGR